MACVSQSLLVYFILFAVFRASYNRSVKFHSHGPVNQTGYSNLEDILSQFSIKPGDLGLTNQGIRTVTITECEGVLEQVERLERQLTMTNGYNNNLNDQVFELKAEVKELKREVDICTSTSSTSIASLQAELDYRIKQLQAMENNNTALTLKITALQTDINVMDNKLRQQNHSTDNSELEKALQSKTSQMARTIEQLERSHGNSKLILEIIALQTEIWELERIEKIGPSNPENINRIKAAEVDLDKKLNQLKGDENINILSLQIMPLDSKIQETKNLITFNIEQFKIQVDDLEQQLKQLHDSLTKKIVQLSHDKQNRDLTSEVMKLQLEIFRIEDLIAATKVKGKITIEELRTSLAEYEKQVKELRSKMDKVDATQANLVLKIINIMKEVRQIQGTQDPEPSITEQIQILQKKIQTMQTESTKNQAEIQDLKEKLQQKTDDCSTTEEKYRKNQNELEDKLEQLKKAGAIKTVTVLRVVSLMEDIKALNNEMAATGDPEKIAALQKELDEKRQELEDKNNELQDLYSKSPFVLNIIELQNQIWDLQRGPVNDTTSSKLADLQEQLNTQINKIQDKDDENTKTILKIITLQSQVENLKRDLDSRHTTEVSQISELKTQLQSKEKELQTQVENFKELDEKNVNLTLSIIDVQHNLRDLQRQTEKERKTSDGRIAKLQEKLAVKESENSEIKARMNELEAQLNAKDANCSVIEEKSIQLQKDLDEKLKELQASSDNVAAIVLQVSILTSQVEELNKKKQSQDANIAELQGMIEQKNAELANLTQQLQARSTQPQRLLQIINLQSLIEKTPVDDDTEIYNSKIAILESRMNALIDGVKKEDNDDTKLILTLLARQQEIARENKKRDDAEKEHEARIKELENDLENAREEYERKIDDLETQNAKTPTINAAVVTLLKKIEQLEDELSSAQEAYAEKIAELNKALTLKEDQLKDCEDLLRASDTKNIELMIEVADLKVKVKNKKKENTLKTTEKELSEVKQQLKTQEKLTKRLETENQALEQQNRDMKASCTNTNDQIHDLEKQLEEMKEEAYRQQQDMLLKDANLNRLQQQYMDSERVKRELQDKNDQLEEDKKKLESTINDLQQIIDSDEDNIIHPVTLTLAHSTANPRIILSDDNREVRLSDEPLDVSDLRGRFDVSLSVMAKSGYSKGRWYWEITVAGKTCYNIGVVSKSAGRRGFIVMRPSNGYWTLTRTKSGQFMAMDNSPVPISLPESPAKVGVLLDCKKGQVSFYDADKRSHIYSFVGQSFTNTIFPIITTCTEEDGNDIPITISSPGLVNWIK